MSEKVLVYYPSIPGNDGTQKYLKRVFKDEESAIRALYELSKRYKWETDVFQVKAYQIFADQADLDEIPVDRTNNSVDMIAVSFLGFRFESQVGEPTMYTLKELQEKYDPQEETEDKTESDVGSKADTSASKEPSFAELWNIFVNALNDRMPDDPDATTSRNSE